MMCGHLRKRRAWRRDAWTRERSAIANAAKARKRMAGPLPEREPRMLPFYRYEFRVRDKAGGETSAWHDLRSVRDMARRIGVLLNGSSQRARRRE